MSIKGPQLRIKSAKEAFEKDFNTGRALLVRRVACFGAGILGWVWQNYSSETSFVLAFFTGILVISYCAVLFLFTREDKIQKTMGEAVILSVVFILGLRLFLLDRLLAESGGARFLACGC